MKNHDLLENFQLNEADLGQNFEVHIWWQFWIQAYCFQFVVVWSRIQAYCFICWCYEAETRVIACEEALWSLPLDVTVLDWCIWELLFAMTMNARCLEHIGHIGSWPACPEFSLWHMFKSQLPQGEWQNKLADLYKLTSANFSFAKLSLPFWGSLP